MGRIAVRPLVTEQQFLALPESTDKIELIDGEVIVSPSPSYWHQEILRRLVLALGVWAARQKNPPTVAQAPLDVRFGRGRILQPDAFVLFARLDPNREGPIDQVPELCIEVLSSNRVHDRVTKRLLYAAAGVKEYWVIDPGGFVERWTGPALSKAGSPRVALSSPLLPKFRLELKRLFAGERKD
jgi:Uma2 family endonuclease